jgi:hypothetical protein
MPRDRQGQAGAVRKNEAKTDADAVTQSIGSGTDVVVDAGGAPG